jgi:hypothetical protein
MLAVCRPRSTESRYFTMYSIGVTQSPSEEQK